MRKQWINITIAICMIAITLSTMIRYYFLNLHYKNNTELILTTKKLQNTIGHQSLLKQILNTSIASNSAKIVQSSNRLETLQWKDFNLDAKFALVNCGTNLNMTKWVPEGVTAKICLFPEHRDRVSATIHMIGVFKTTKEPLDQLQQCLNIRKLNY